MTASTPREAADVTAGRADWDWMVPALRHAGRADHAEQPGFARRLDHSVLPSLAALIGGPPARVASCTLPAGSESVRAARDFTRAILHGWAEQDQAADAAAPQSRPGAGPRRSATASQPADEGAASAATCVQGVAGHGTASGECTLGELCDDVGLAASELVSNAVRHGIRTAVVADGAIRLGLVSSGSTVFCAVTDPGAGIPVMRDPDSYAESGRGLHVIASVSGAWGWTPPGSSGKVVWAAFPSDRQRKRG